MTVRHAVFALGADREDSDNGAPMEVLRRVRAEVDPSKYNILIVDDDESMRRMVAEVLGAAGYNLSEASDGKQALRLLAEKKIQLVLTELVMPETEGLELIQQMHKAEPDIRVIAMSGSPRAATYLSVARALGARAALYKPLPVDQLLQTVQEVLAAP